MSVVPIDPPPYLVTSGLLLELRCIDLEVCYVLNSSVILILVPFNQVCEYPHALTTVVLRL